MRTRERQLEMESAERSRQYSARTMLLRFPGDRVPRGNCAVIPALGLVLLCLPLSVEKPGWPIVAAPADVVSVHVPVGAGLRLKGRLHIPTLLRGEPTAPAVLLLQGVPPVDTCEDFAVGLRDAGIHCLVLHYRGYSGSEGAFSMSTLASDVTAALDWLARFHFPSICLACVCPHTHKPTRASAVSMS